MEQTSFSELLELFSYVSATCPKLHTIMLYFVSLVHNLAWLRYNLIRLVPFVVLQIKKKLCVRVFYAILIILHQSLAWQKVFLLTKCLD